MNIKVNKKIERPLLARTELQADVHFDGATPKRTDLQKSLAAALKVSEDAVAIRRIYTNFGARSAKFTANIYKTKEDLLKNELAIFINKGKPKEKKEAKKEEKK